MAAHGQDGHAKRVALYAAEDLPLVDAVIQDILGGLVGTETVATMEA